MNMVEAAFLKRMRELKERYVQIMNTPASQENDMRQNDWEQDVLRAVRIYVEGRIS